MTCRKCHASIPNHGNQHLVIHTLVRTAVMKRLFLAITLLALTASAVKAEDFGLWSEVGIQQNLRVRGLSAELGYDIRLNNHVKGVTRRSFNVGLNYSLTRNLKVGATYAYIYSFSKGECEDKYNTDDDGNIDYSQWKGYNYTQSFWRNKHRFIGYLKGDIDLGRFNLSLRERYQHTVFQSTKTTKEKYRYNTIYDEDDNVSYELKGGYPELEEDGKRSKVRDYLRQKVELTYNIRHCPINPDVSVEMENNLHNSFHIDEMRYVAGAVWKVTKQIHLGLHYRFHKGEGDDDDSNMHAIEFSLKFKNPFWRAKK